MFKFFSSWAVPFGAGWAFGIGGFLFLLLLVWSVAWKGLALWKAAREESKPWFIVLLLLNTAGILEILYIYIFSKKSGHAVVSK